MDNINIWNKQNLIDWVKSQPNFVKVDLAAVDTPGGLFSFPVPWDCLVGRVVLDVTNPSAGACTADVGVAAGATTSADDKIDGQTLAATGLLSTAGTNGKTYVKATADKFVTGSVSTGASAGLVGSAYVELIGLQ